MAYGLAQSCHSLRNQRNAVRQARAKRGAFAWSLGALLSMALLSSSAGAAPVTTPDRVEPTPIALTPEVALEQLKRENLLLESARHDLAATRADVITAGLIPNPRLFVGGTWLMHGTPSGGHQEYQLGAEQELPITGLAGVRRDAARATLTAAELEYATLGWELIFQMRSAYLDLELAQEQLHLAQAALSDLEHARAIIEIRAKSGANPTYDLLRLGIERSRRVATVAEATSAVLQKRVALAHSIGPSVAAATVSVTARIEMPTRPRLTGDELVRHALRQRPEIAAARSRVVASELKTRALSRQYVPSPQLSLGYARWAGVPTDQGNRDGGALMAGISLPVPIFDHGQGTVDRSRAETLAASSRRTQVEVMVRRQTEGAERQLTLRLDAWQAFIENTPAEADRMRQVAETAYREGRATILELLDAYNAHFSVQELGLTLRAEALRAAAVLEWAIGPNSAL